VNVSGHVRALLPEARVRDAVTGANWGSTGVAPELPCEPADILKSCGVTLTAIIGPGQRDTVLQSMSSALGPPDRADRGDRTQVLDQHPVDGEPALA
jgi:hypothetical protein